MSNPQRIVRLAGVLLLLIGGVLVATAWLSRAALPFSAASPTPATDATPLLASPTPTSGVTPTLTPTPAPIPPTQTPEPIIPTRTPSATASPEATASPVVPTSLPDAENNTVTPVATLSLSGTAVPGALVVPAADHWRLGVSLPYGASLFHDLAPLKVRWVMDWRMGDGAALPEGVRYAQTVRMKFGVLSADVTEIAAVAAARPGSLWLISNEADVRWQDNVDPETYAGLYHEAYTVIKAGDPTAVVAAGGISQPTPLRLRYLDRVLEVYQDRYGQPLPVEAWHIHNYMLREERDSWGVDIPPGLADNTGVLYEIEDSGNVEVFGAQIEAFRVWMTARGYGGLPLHISEFGIPMPPDYGYPPEKVAEFLRETWRYMLTASDEAHGDPNDAHRLVQSWCWFSWSTLDYPSGNLVEMETGAWTDLGRAWMVMVGVE